MVNWQWDLPGLINFWSCSPEFQLFPGFWEIKEFLHICGQTNYQIELIFGGRTHFETPQAWLTLGHAQLNFNHMLFLCICTKNAYWIELKYQLSNMVVKLLWDSSGLVKLQLYSTEFLQFSLPNINLSTQCCQWYLILISLMQTDYFTSVTNFKAQPNLFW